MCEKKNNGCRSRQGDSLARELIQKTELKEVMGRPPEGMTQEKFVAGVFTKLVRKAAMEAVKEEIEMLNDLIESADTTDEKVKVIKELADLKLRAIGIVLASMGARGAPQRLEPKAKTKKRQKNKNS